MAKLDRLLTLIHALADNPEGLSLDEMAAHLDVNRRTAERMRDIVMLHFDLEPLNEGRIKRWRIAGKLGRMFTLPTAEELAALQSEVDALKLANQPARAGLLNGLLAKVRGALDTRARTRTAPDFEALTNAQRIFVPAGPGIPAPPEVLVVAQQAIMAGAMVEFNYQADGKPAPQWRRVVPCGLVHGAVSYLIGQLPDSTLEPVFYRLDRMSNAQVSQKAGTPPVDFDLDEWMSRSFGIWREAAYHVSLKILPEATDRASQWRFHRNQHMTLLDDGGLRVEFQSGGLRELAEHLCTWAGCFVVESPEELRSELKLIAEGILSENG